jgi:hypothetical protein
MWNRIDTTINAADWQDLKNLFDTLKSKLNFMVGLTGKERTGGWIRSPKALIFMQRVLSLAKGQPLNFPAVDMAALERDLQLIRQIEELESQTANIARQLKDTRLHLTKEAAGQAMLVYNIMQAMHHSGVPGAEGFKELQEYLPRTGKPGRPKIMEP